jgi:DnaJ-class molecular chaperone
MNDHACPKCDGSGMIPAIQALTPAVKSTESEVLCPECLGTGGHKLVTQHKPPGEYIHHCCAGAMGGNHETYRLGGCECGVLKYRCKTCGKEEWRKT